MTTNKTAKQALNDLYQQGRDKGYSQGYEAGKDEVSRRFSPAITALKKSYMHNDCQHSKDGLIELLGKAGFESWAWEYGVL